MIVSLIIIAFIIYLLYYSKVDSTKIQWYIYPLFCVPGLFDPMSAFSILVMGLVYGYFLYREGDLDTVSWLESIYDHI